MEITTKIGCSINCKYCPQQLLIEKYCRDKDRPIIMTYDLFKRCIDKIPLNITIDFAGMCEPWLNPACTEMVEYAVHKGHEIRIYTTLVGVTESDIERLSKLPIKQFVLHIPDKNGNSHICIDKNYLKLLEKLMNTSISGLKSISCHGEIADAIENILNDEWGKDGGQLIDRAGNVQNEDVAHRHIVGQIICSECGCEFNHNILLPDGTVLLCCMDYGMKHVLGDLYENSYESLFCSKEVNAIKENIQQNDGEILCRSCSNACSNQEIAKYYIQYKGEAIELWNTQMWLQAQLKNEIEEKEHLKSWCSELEEGKNWTESQYESLKSENERMKEWCSELEEGKNWTESQYESLKSENERMKEWCSELEKGKNWTESQYENIKSEYDKLKSWCDEMQNAKDWIESEWKNKCEECKELKELLANQQEDCLEVAKE